MKKTATTDQSNAILQEAIAFAEEFGERTASFKLHGHAVHVWTEHLAWGETRLVAEFLSVLDAADEALIAGLAEHLEEHGGPLISARRAAEVLARRGLVESLDDLDDSWTLFRQACRCLS